MFEYPGYAYNRNLLNENWVRDAKAALAKTCNIEKITAMSRERVGELLASVNQKDFDEAFKAAKALSNEPAQNAPAVAKQNQGPVLK